MMASDSTQQKGRAKRSEGEEPLSAFDLPPAPSAPLDVREIPLTEIELLQNIRPAHHGIEGLAETMHLEGQLQPCVVRPAPENASYDNPYELVFGYRRFLAAQSLGWESIRCEVRDVPDESKRRQLIIENMQREQLSSLGEARAMYELRYSADPPLSNAEVARQLGCDPSHVSHRLNMLIKLAPPRQPDAPPPAHEVHAQRAAMRQEAYDGDEDPDESGDEEGTEGDSEFDEIARVQEAAPEPSAPVSTALVFPGDPSPTTPSSDEEGGEDAEDANGEEKPSEPQYLDILALVDAGTISASTAEVIASLETRADQEQLTKLAIRHGWGVKKAAQWAREAKKEDIEGASDSDALGPVEMLTIDDVVPLQKLHLRAQLTDADIARLTLYMQLRNGMDQEVLDFISERLGYAYETLWDYITLLDDDQVTELKRRLAIRYVTAAHRFFDLEPTLKDAYGLPEEASDEEQRAAVEEASLALPGADYGESLSSPTDDLLALGPEAQTDETSDEDDGETPDEDDGETLAEDYDETPDEDYDETLAEEDNDE